MTRLSKMTRIGGLLLGTSAIVLAGAAIAHEEIYGDGAREDNKHLAHAPGVADGHVPNNINYGFDLVGWDTLGGIETARYTDVWAKDGFAFVGTFQEPTCDKSGVYVSDIRDPSNPETVAHLRSPSNTRINDVKVHTIGDRDVLITTYERCGVIRSGAAQGDTKGGSKKEETKAQGGGKAQGNDQKGFAGIGIYDVTDPAHPKPLSKYDNLPNPVHNTFPWTTDDGKTYLAAVDNVQAADLWLMDISDPTEPVIINNIGPGDWIPEGLNLDQIQTGVFAFTGLHDVWVERIPAETVAGIPALADAGITGDRWHIALPYWDLGFVTLDVTDPANPIFLGDSTYFDEDPVLKLNGNGAAVAPMEGNAHAAVYGGENFQYIWAGDEDFDALSVGITYLDSDGVSISAGATQGGDVPQIGPGADFESLAGTPIFIGEACNGAGIDMAPEGDYIALVERGTCAFTDKLAVAEAAGFDAMVVFNQDRDDRCEATVSMLITGGVPALFVPRSVGFDMLHIDDYNPDECGTVVDSEPTDVYLPELNTIGPVSLDIGAVTDGWGYFHVLANTTGVEFSASFAPDMMGMDNRPAEYLEHIGYYAPAEVGDPEYATGYGDLTAHNVEYDPSNPDQAFISWYSLGMRAVEYRNGHYHTPALYDGKPYGVDSWNVHETGRWIASPEAYGELADGIDPELLEGSNFWGVHVTEIDGEQYILGSDRSTGLHIFSFECVGRDPSLPAIYCDPNR